MHQAGLIVWGALEEMRKMVKPGITTKELDEFAEEYTVEQHAHPAFKGYRGYPGSVCTSINQEVVHGIPSSSRRLREGDILSMDFGVELDGYFGDAALTLPVGKISPERRKAAARDARIAGPRHRESPARQPARGCFGRGAGVGREERLFGGARVCGARHRDADARRAAGSELRNAEAGAAVAGRNGSGHRADGEYGRPGRPGSGR